MEGFLVRTVQRWFVVRLGGVLMFGGGCSTGSTSTGQANKTLILETTFSRPGGDPAVVAGNTGVQMVEQMYQTLLMVDDKDTTKLDPYLAESYSVSPDGLSVTFKLRSDVHFSDGTPLTSADAVFSMNRLINIGGSFGSFVVDQTASAVDQYTVKVTSSHPDPSIAADWAIPTSGILNSKVAIANGGSSSKGASTADTLTPFLNQHSAGSGPYVLRSLEPSSLVVLTMSPNYWGTKPVYTRLEFVNVPSSTQALDVQKNLSTDAFDLSPAQIQGLDTTKVTVRTLHSLEVFLIQLSADPKVSPNSANLNFRQAVRYGIDYQRLLQIAGYGSIQAQGILATGIPGALPANQIVKRDVAKARAHLGQSGLQNPSINLEFATDQTASGVPLADLAQSIQAALKEVGIEVKLVGEPYVTWIARWKDDKMQMMIKPAAGNSFDSSTAFNFAPGGVAGRFMGPQLGVDPTVDAAVEAARTARTEQERAPLMVKEQAAVNEEAFFIPLLSAGPF